MANNSINYQQNAVFAIEFLWKLEYCKRDAVAFTVSKILRDQKIPASICQQELI